MLLRRVTILGCRTTLNQLVAQQALKQQAVNIANSEHSATAKALLTQPGGEPALGDADQAEV